MIPLDKYMRGVNGIINSKPVYKLGGDGRAGECDCIGLIIGAIRRAGGEWKGAHGSNYAARNEMQTLESPPRLEVGAAVYKYHEPGQAGWNLPAAYANHPDQNDYYHVGVVMSVNPLRIAHCTSWSGGSGIKIDTVIGKWRRGGRLKKVGYAAEPPQEGEDMGDNEKWVESNQNDNPVIAYIDLPTTDTVKYRIKPNKDSPWWGTIRGGTAVEIYGGEPGWDRVFYNGKDGYVMSQFITTKPPAQPDPMPPATTTDIVHAQYDRVVAELEKLRKLL